MESPKIIHKTSLAVIKNKKMLMTREKKNPEVFYTLGGKIKDGENEEESLHREVWEEVACRIKEGTLRFFQEFQAPAHGRENTFVNIKLYGAELLGEPAPASEIDEIRYFDSTIDEKHLTPISADIFSWLKENGHID